jgi:ACS family hexuronate transporter-like MFS transporter
VLDRKLDGQTDWSRLKWWILALSFLAGTLNYVDRQVIAILKPVLQAEFGWSDQDYGHLGTIFQFSAALTYLGIGYVIDRVGLWRGYAAGVSIWSAACMAHAAASQLAQFMVARVVLAAAEAVQTPASMKAIAEWFPQNQRALAVGIVNTSSNIGAIIAPLLVPFIAIQAGWRAAFLVTGALGFVWLIAWWTVPAQTQGQPVATETPGDRPRLKVLLGLRPTWAIVSAKALTDMVWWFLLFWAPDFLHRQFQLDLKSAGPPLAAIYGLAALGAFTGGLLPTCLLRQGVSANGARKVSMLIYALLITPLPLVLQVSNPWYAVLFIGMALFAHQGFSTNIFAIAVEAFDARSVATVISFGALAGNTSGMLMLEFTGWVLTHHHTYLPMFVISASVYLVALGLIHLLLPQLRPHTTAATP